MKDFNNKLVVITGAATGMGRAYALAFARLGSHLALSDIDPEQLKETVNQVKSIASVNLISECFDIADIEQTESFAEKVKQQLGTVDVVINNAGIEGSCEPVWATQSDWYRKVMAVNFFGVVNGTQAFLPQLREKNSGVIVNVSSIFGLVGAPNHADYCASKFAVRGFTEALMAELNETNIQVHLLHPGGINTLIARKPKSREFAKQFLTTSATDVAEFVIESIQKNKIRMVYGNNAYKTFLGMRLLPLKFLKSFIWSEMKSVIELKNYKMEQK